MRNKHKNQINEKKNGTNYDENKEKNNIIEAIINKKHNNFNINNINNNKNNDNNNNNNNKMIKNLLTS